MYFHFIQWKVCIFFQFPMLFNENLRLEKLRGETVGRTYGRTEIHPCVLQDIGPLGPLPKKGELFLNQTCTVASLPCEWSTGLRRSQHNHPRKIPSWSESLFLCHFEWRRARIYSFASPCLEILSLFVLFAGWIGHEQISALCSNRRRHCQDQLAI